ncbi:MAG: Bug family tripartite tricarboxylate transporter substrate binding protein [Pseudorhodoplanes sp.]
MTSLRIGRYLAALTAALLALISAMPGAQAAYPDRPIRLIVPYPAGGSSDIVARSFAEYFERAMGQPIVIENVGGAGGYNGAMRVATAAPDGYTLLIGAGSELLIRNLLQPSPVADPMRQYTPISLIGAGPMVLVGKPDIKATDLKAVIALANGQASGLNYGSAGHGTFMHLVGEAVKFRTNAKVTHVPYKGAAPVMTDVVGGHVDLGVSSLATALPFIKDGKARAFAVTSADRTEFAPDIPTLAEFPDLKGFSLELWIGLFGPAGLPADIVAKLEQASRAVLDEPGLKTKLANGSISVRKLSGAEFKAFLDAENQKYKKIITDSEIKGQ